MSYPQHHGHWQQPVPQYPQGHRPPPPPGYGPPPHAYPPPPPPPPGRRSYSADERLRRGRKVQKVSLVIVLLLLVTFGVYFFLFHNSRPDVGDCLSTLEYDKSLMGGGYQVVECTDASAAFEIVAEDEARSQLDLDACAGHPGGQTIDGRKGRRASSGYWQVCAVPVG